MISALTRLGMTVLLVAAATAGAAALMHQADATAEAKQAATSPAANDIAPLPLDLPKPHFRGTPPNVPLGTRVKITNDPNKPRDPFLAPKGTRNVAFKRPVTASDNEPVFGTLDLITNGDKEAIGDSYVELGPGVQWVQIDLSSAMPIHAIVLWHDHRQPLVYHDVIVQISDDKDFIENVRTIFNNDHDNSAGLGIGEDWGYFETNEGLLLPAKGVKARYVRLYSNGNTGGDDLNRYTEVEVYGLPVEAAKPATLSPQRGRQHLAGGAKPPVTSL